MPVNPHCQSFALPTTHCKYRNCKRLQGSKAGLINLDVVIGITATTAHVCDSHTLPMTNIVVSMFNLESPATQTAGLSGRESETTGCNRRNLDWPNAADYCGGVCIFGNAIAAGHSL